MTTHKEALSLQQIAVILPKSRPQRHGIGHFVRHVKVGGSGSSSVRMPDGWS